MIIIAIIIIIHWFGTPPPGCGHWSLSCDKKWDVPGNVSNRKRRPEPTKKTEKKTAADDASERRESIVSGNFKLMKMVANRSNQRTPNVFRLAGNTIQLSAVYWW